MTPAAVIAARRRQSLRTKLLGVIVVGAILPLAAIGLWLSRSAVRSGEELLRSQVNVELDRLATGIETRWTHRRSDVALLANNDPLQRALSQPSTDSVPAFVARAFETMPSIQSATIRDSSGAIRWILGDGTTDVGVGNGTGIVARSPTILLSVPVPGEADTPVGVVDARVRVSALIPGTPLSAGTEGPILGVRESSTSSWLVPPAAPPEFLSEAQFDWSGSRWLVVRRAMADPPIELIQAARLDPVVTPFARNARLGAIALGIAAVVVILLTAFATLRLTRSLEELAVAADAVSQGDFDRRVANGGHDEVGRVSRAFNTMTENLRRILRERSQTEAFSAMGELSGALAHQVRSPLTAMRIDLQRVEEKLGTAEHERGLVRRSIAQIDRLERAVGGTLRIARSAAGTWESVDLWIPLERAIEGAEPEFQARNAALHVSRNGDDQYPIRGDAATLEQLFSNVLFNAAQSLGSGQSATVSLAHDDGHVSVVIEDTGTGMDEETQRRAFEPFYSTKPEGTGIGLAVAQRIMLAHEGTIRLASDPGRGTRVELRFKSEAS